MRDKYNLNLIPKGQEAEEYDDIVTAPAIPGISHGGDEEEQNYFEEQQPQQQQPVLSDNSKDIPGLSMFLIDEHFTVIYLLNMLTVCFRFQ